MARLSRIDKSGKSRNGTNENLDCIEVNEGIENTMGRRIGLVLYKRKLN